jgi:drug/metabolite transporter (DMT)-like permease
MLFYRGAIPFFIVLIGLLLFYRQNFINAFFKVGIVGIFYAISFSICNITFIVSIQNTNVANTLIMIALAPMLSAILGAIFLKEMPSKGTWIAIFITFLAALFIFYDSLQVGNLFGNIMGFVTAAGLAVNAVLIRYAKDRDLLPSAVMGKLGVAVFAFFFVENFNLIGTDQIYIPIMCIICVALPFVLVTIAPRFIPAEEVNLFFLLETIIGPIWVWLVVKEQPTLETIIGGAVIIITLGIHSFIKLREPEKIIN